MGEPVKVQWPGKALNAEADDLRPPLESLLKGLKLTKVPGEGAGAGVIESTTLEITKQVKRLITGAGGTAVVAGAAGSAWAAVSDDTALAVALAAGVAFVLGAAILGLAKIMDGDVRGRAAVTTEQVNARAIVAKAFLERGVVSSPAAADQTPASSPKATLADDFRAALAAYGDRLEIETPEGSSLVRGLAWGTNGLRIRLQNGDLIDVSEAMGFRTST